VSQAVQLVHHGGQGTSASSTGAAVAAGEEVSLGGAGAAIRGRGPNAGRAIYVRELVDGPGVTRSSGDDAEVRRGVGAQIEQLDAATLVVDLAGSRACRCRAGAGQDTGAAFHHDSHVPSSSAADANEAAGVSCSHRVEAVEPEVQRAGRSDLRVNIYLLVAAAGRDRESLELCDSSKVVHADVEFPRSGSVGGDSPNAELEVDPASLEGLTADWGHAPGDVLISRLGSAGGPVGESPASQVDGRDTAEGESAGRRNSVDGSYGERRRD